MDYHCKNRDIEIMIMRYQQTDKMKHSNHHHHLAANERSLEYEQNQKKEIIYYQDGLNTLPPWRQHQQQIMNTLNSTLRETIPLAWDQLMVLPKHRPGNLPSLDCFLFTHHYISMQSLLSLTYMQTIRQY